MFGIVGWLVARGLSHGVARKLAVAGAALAFCVCVAGLAALWLHFHDKGVVADEHARQDARAAVAREASADERVADTIVNTTNEEKAHAIVEGARDDGAPSAAAVALGCERLRRARWKELPEPCRRGGGDGSQAATDR